MYYIIETIQQALAQKNLQQFLQYFLIEEIDEKEFLNLNQNEITEILSRHIQNKDIIKIQQIAANIFNVITIFNNVNSFPQKTNLKLTKQV